MKLIRTLARNTEGVTAVEFAFIAPIFLGFLFVLFDLGRVYLLRSSLDYALSEAGRYALVHTSATDAQLVSQVTSAFHGGSSSNLQVTSSTQTLNGQSYHVMTASYPAASIVSGFMHRGNVTLTSTASIPINP